MVFGFGKGVRGLNVLPVRASAEGVMGCVRACMRGGETSQG